MTMEALRLPWWVRCSIALYNFVYGFEFHLFHFLTGDRVDRLAWITMILLTIFDGVIFTLIGIDSLVQRGFGPVVGWSVLAGIAALIASAYYWGMYVPVKKPKLSRKGGVR